MREPTEIRLDQLIIHIVNPTAATGLVLSERTLPLPPADPVAEYFAEHIRKSLTDPAAKAASFVALGPDTAASVCGEMLANPASLVAGSQWLARRLYDVVARDKRISPGDLAVCLYRADAGANTPPYVGLLKMDPGTAYRHRTQRDAEGKLYVGLEPQAEVMPSPEERLQKCAFVRSMDPRPAYDMMLVDKQQRERLPRAIARFFTADFLGAELALDAQERTVRLYRGLVSAQNQLRPELTAEENERLAQAVQAAIAARSIDLDIWLGALRLPAEVVARIDELVSHLLPDRSFEIDVGIAARLTSRRRFSGDHGLRLEVAADRYDDVIESVEHVVAADAPPHYRVVIRTEKWEELPR